MAHKQQPPESSDVNDLVNGVASMAVASGTSPASATAFKGEEIYIKGPKKNEQPNKSGQRMHQTASAMASGASAAHMSMGLLAQQQQAGYNVSPLTPMSDQAWPSEQLAQQPQLQVQQPIQPLSEGFEDEFLNELLGPQEGCHASQKPQPAPISAMSVPAYAPAPSPTASAASRATVSETTRSALINKLRPQPLMVDDNFNTPLHLAVLQEKTSEQVDFLLSDLQNQEKLQPIINMININGHTPLSLCLKMRRHDLVSMLLAFDAAPTQLCGAASERCNHFHYAMAKCVDSKQSLQLVCALIYSVCKHCQQDLSGMLVKNRCGKTAMDFLRLRISQLNGQPDPASSELLCSLKSLYTWLTKQLGVAS